MVVFVVCQGAGFQSSTACTNRVVDRVAAKKKPSILPEEVRQKLIGAKSFDIEAWHMAHLHQKLELLTPG